MQVSNKLCSKVMLVRALVEYKVLGDDEYIYIEPFETHFKEGCEKFIDYYLKIRVIKTLAKRRIVIKELKNLSVDYVRD